MSIHIGNRVRWLVENKYSGTKKGFSERLGFANEPNLFKIFNKANLNTAIIFKICEVLNIPIEQILSEKDIDIVSEPHESYGKKKVEELEIELLRHRVKDLEKIVQMQECEIERCRKSIPVKK